MSEKRSNNESLSFFNDLENKAAGYPVHIVKINRDSGKPLGILLLQHGVDPKEALDILRSITLPGRFPNSPATVHTGADTGKPGAALLAHLPEQSRLKTLLATELDRVRSTRLPCSLVLVELDDFSAAKNCGDPLYDTALQRLASLIQENLHLIDLFAKYGQQGFSMVLPGTNLGKAKNLAEKIRNAARLQQTSQPGDQTGQTVSIGIAVCHTYDAITPEKFLESAMHELQRAKKHGGDRICHVAGSRKADSCQVSLDERALLLNFSQK